MPVYPGALPDTFFPPPRCPRRIGGVEVSAALETTVVDQRLVLKLHAGKRGQVWIGLLLEDE